jgi:hypothetical protein
MGVQDVGQEGLEIVPLVVVTQAFPARPSSLPEIREFVRRGLTQSPLSDDDLRTLTERAAEVLLDAAGQGGMLQVSLRIFPDYAEVDVLYSEIDPGTGTGLTASAPSARAPAPVEEERAAVPAPASFSAWLAEALRRDGLTMEAAATLLGVSAKTISRWIGGVTQPRLRDLARIREVFGEVPFP